MQRYNSFHLIHKGLRASLFRTALQLQQADFTCPQETAETLDRVREIVMLFDGHAHKEDAYILPAIDAYEPSVVATLQAEHAEDEALGRQLNERIERQAQASTPGEKISRGIQLTEAFIAFMVFNLNHMAKEEDIVNKALWRYYSDDEIKQLTGKISENTPPWIMAYYATWMLRGINDTEAVTWMKAIEGGMPELAFRSLLQTAQEEWPETRFLKVTNSLIKGLQPASKN